MQPFKCRIEKGELKPLDLRAWRSALKAWAQPFVWVDFQTEERVRSNAQNAYWWAVVVPAIGQCWAKEREWALAPHPTVIHGALISACFGTDETPLGRERRSSTTLTTKEFTDLIEWAREYALRKYTIHIPEPNEAPA